MIRNSHRCVRICRRIRDNPMRLTLERYVAYLTSRRYSPGTLRQYISAVEHFGRWVGQKTLTRSTVERFIRQHLPTCRCRMPTTRNLKCNRAALNRLLEMAGPVRIAAPFANGFAGQLLLRYQEHLVTVRGLAASTVRKRLTWARDMLHGLRVCGNEQLAAWTPDRVAGYVVRKARGQKPSSGQAIACAIRSFLRFLQHEGLICRDLAAVVPTFAWWRLAPLPQTLCERELRQLINAADIRTPLGLRDRAILLCMSELGLRASDVAGLELDGVDLTARVLRLCRPKQRKSMAVPMPQQLADALDAYLRGARPSCDTRNVFVLHRAPVGKPLGPLGIRGVVLRLAGRAGLQHRIGGTHILRHSVASRMLSAGASLKQVADLLGHQSINTTAIYAKVDFNALSQVALPWPGAKEVQL